MIVAGTLFLFIQSITLTNMQSITPSIGQLMASAGELPEICTLPNQEDPIIIETTVDRVVDGDTARFFLEGRSVPMRFLNIDTPETNYQGHEQPKWGAAAKNELSRVLKGGDTVKLEIPGADRCDTNGRVLGWVFKGTKNINKHMVEKALAVNYCIFPHLDRCEELGQIVMEKESKQEGMFGDPDFVIPYEWRLLVSGRQPDKYVGSMETKEVYRPDRLTEIDPGLRVFFFKKSHIQDPWIFIE